MFECTGFWRKNVILLLLLSLFLIVFFLPTFQNLFVKESFESENVMNLIPMEPQIGPQNGWFFQANKLSAWNNMVYDNSITKPDKTKVLKITDLYVSNSPVKLDRQQMTVSFWIYLYHSELSYTWQPLFQMGKYEGHWDTFQHGDEYLALPERSPGMWIWPHGHNSIHLRTPTDNPSDKHPEKDYFCNRWFSETVEAGGPDWHEVYGSIPVRIPTLMTVVFSGQTNILYMNGQKVKSWTTHFPIRTLNEKVEEYLYVGSGDRGSSNNFALAYFRIYPKPLTENEVLTLFTRMKTKASRDPDFNLRTLENKFADYKNVARADISTMTGYNQKQLPKNIIVLGTLETKNNASSLESYAKNAFMNPQQMTPSNSTNTITLDHVLYYWLDSDKKLTFLEFNGQSFMPFTCQPTQTTSNTTFTICFWYKVRCPTFQDIDKMDSNPASTQNKNFVAALKRIHDIDWNKGSCNINWNDQETMQALYEAWGAGTIYHSLGDSRSGDNSCLISLMSSSLSHKIAVYMYYFDLKVFSHRHLYASMKSGTDNNWHHFALVMDNTTYKIYNNGSLQYTHYEQSPFPGIQSFESMFIGTDLDKQQFYNGKLADIKIYETALTQSEIVQVMNSLPNA